MRTAAAGCPPRPPGGLGRRAALVLLLLAVVPYLNGLSAGFTFDDEVVARDDPRLASPSRVGEVFSSGHFGAPLATAKNYRPVALLTFAAHRWTTGTRPLPFHAVNVALHAATTLLLATWLLGLGMPRAPSLAGAALFAVVPVHVEAVTGVVGRFELLVAALVLGAAVLFRRATDGARLARLPYAAALLAFLAALFSKEHAVVLPGVVVLGELLRQGTGERTGARLARKALAFAGLLVPLAAFAAVRALLVGEGLVAGKAAFFDLDNPLAPLPGPLRVANALWLLLRYAWQSIVPLGLSADHSAHALDLVSRLSDLRAVAGLGGVAAIAAIGLASQRRAPLVSLGAGLFLGAFVPTSNVLFPIGTIYADRLAYLPSAGLLAMAAGLVCAFPSFSAGFRKALLAVALATYSGATVARNEVFRDDSRLFEDMLRKVPRSARARYNAAWLAWGRKDAVVARANAEEAVGLFPRYYDAWSLLGLVRAGEGRFDEARAACREALRLRPDYEIGFLALARIEADTGRLAEAEAAVLEGLRHRPGSGALLSRRAALLHSLARFDEARTAWDAAIAAPGGGAAERLGLARTLSSLGRKTESVSAARRALALSPGLLEARLFLAERYEEGAKPLAAAAELARAVRSAPRDPKPARLLLELALRAPEARAVAATALVGIEATFGRPARNLALRRAVEAFGARATGPSLPAP